ncbi:MAG: serine/threonine-protein kinase [Balneolaceae bacterium]
MTTNTWKILSEVLETPELGRVERLKELCGERTDLYNSIAPLLDDASVIDDWWDTSFRLNAAILEDVYEELHIKFPSLEEIIGTHLGAYKIIELIGSGGMGNVFLAKRDDGTFERDVAIKLMNFSMNTDDVQRRFESEQRILASLNFPGIAQLYDASLVDDNTPYFVMEYVDGMDVVSYAIDNALSTTDRLHLFSRICEAVAFAHSNLIIHRDLKPSNILVTKDGNPKILDFGISSFIEEFGDHQSNENKTAITLSYSAPELIENQSISTSIDIYALGILLYELLTGSHPFQLKDKGQDEALEIVFNTKTPSILAHDIKSRDLDAIIQKATQKKPDDRYKSVETLLDDIRRVQNNIPINARKTGSLERSLKLWKRYPFGVSVSTLSLIGLLGFGAFYNVQITKERDIAQREAQKATVTKDYLIDLFKSANPLNAPGEKQTVEDFLNVSVENLKGLDSEPQIKEEASYTLAQVSFHLADFAKAESLYYESLNLNQNIFKTPTQHQANVLQAIASIYINNGDYKVAKELADSALSVNRTMFNENSLEVASTKLMVANIVAHLGNLDSAETLIRESERVFERQENPDYPLLIQALHTSADISREAEDYERSVRVLTQLTQILEQHAPDDRFSFSVAQNDLGFSNRMLEQYDLAIEAYEQSLEVLEVLYGKTHPNTLNVLLNLATVYALNGDVESSEAIYIDRIERSKEQYGSEHWRLGQAYSAIAGFYQNTGSFDKSVKEYDNVIALYASTLGDNHFWTNRARLNKSISETLSGDLKSSSFFAETLSRIKTNVDGRLTYYNYSSFERMKENVEKYELTAYAKAITDFMTWHDATYAQ